jgi:hypothetical protein
MLVNAHPSILSIQSVPYAQLVAALDMPLPPDGSVRVLEDFLINECLTQASSRVCSDAAVLHCPLTSPAIS